MNRLILFQPGATGTWEEFVIENSEPDHEDIMKILQPRSGIWEHVSILLDGQRAHLFVDDNGRAFNLEPNVRASIMYANNSLKKIGRQPYSLEHLLSEEKKLASWDDIQFILDNSLIIVGPALLWTGELS